MADSRSDSDTGDDAGTPRWVKVFGIIFLIVVLLFLILLFTRGPHRPGDHMSSGGANRHSAARIRH